ncbi:MAG: hypothetical protein VXX01_07870, partial [Pseudomonadota bacterium]|nr:hypothetical protein [Pseudomonadota bacterium]
RGKGSDYRINKTRKTAGEVKLLFSDAGSGASSSAIVSQGRVAAIINAKPVDRRQILEEAAGIVGLSARRREAESRLRAAETNLERLDTVMNALQERLKTLESQAKQAEKYRRLSERMTRLNAQLHYLQWVAQTRSTERAKEALVQAERRVADAEAGAAKANAAAIELSTDLPDLQKKEAEAGAALQALLVGRDGLDRDLAEIERLLDVNTNQRRQLEQDQVREANLVSDAQSALDRLVREEGELQAAGEGAEAAFAKLESAVEAASAEVTRLDQAMADARAEMAQVGAEISARKTALDQATQRVEALQARRDRLLGQIGDIEGRNGSGADPEEARNQVAGLRAEHDSAAAALAAAEVALAQAQDDEQQARSLADTQGREVAQLRAEFDGLQRLLAASDKGEAASGRPVLSDIRVQDGYEIALAALLSDALQAPATARDSGDFWSEAAGTGPMALPADVRAMTDLIDDAPAALRPRLAACGVADSADDATALQSQLQAGQWLTTPK